MALRESLPAGDGGISKQAKGWSLLACRERLKREHGDVELPYKVRTIQKTSVLKYRAHQCNLNKKLFTVVVVGP